MSIALPVFNTENFHIRAARMEASSEEHDLWLPFEEELLNSPFS